MLLRKCILTTALVLGFILGSQAAFASERMTRIIEAHPMTRPEPARTCLEFFSTLFQVVDTRHVSSDYRKVPMQQSRRNSAERAAETDSIVRSVLNDWVNSRDYTQEQADMLLERDRRLDPRRTGYLQFESDGHPAVLRIFDGSTTVLRAGVEWKDASVSSALTPLEIGSPGFELPERRWARESSGRPAFIWEIGLLNVDRQIHSGVETALGHVGQLLDLHYNNGERNLLGKTKVIERRQMMIYAQTRPNRVELLKEYGFQPVYSVNSAGIGSQLEVARNSVLMYIKAEDFLRIHTLKAIFVQTKAEPRRDVDYEAVARETAMLRERLENFESQRVSILSMDDALRESQTTMQYYARARLMRGRTVEREAAALAFFESYARLINSLPQSLRAANWLQYQSITRSSLSHPVMLEALYLFARAMDASAATSINMNAESEAEFFGPNQPVTPFRLAVPTNPTAVLTFGREL